MRVATLSFTISAVLLGCAGVARGQGEAKKQKAPDLPTRVENLETETKQLREKIVSLKKKIVALENAKKEFDALKREVKSNTGAIIGLTELVDKKTDEIKNLKEAIRDLARNENGSYYPNLLGKMSNKAFRIEAMRVVQGKFIINNQTNFSQTLFVNGVRWRIPKGPHPIWIPVGVVRFRLSHEQPKEYSDWKPIKDFAGRITHQELKITIRYPKPKAKAF